MLNEVDCIEEDNLLNRNNADNDLKIFSDILRMTNGNIQPNTSARKRFLEVVAGKRRPQTEWEIIYYCWEEAGKPEIEAWFRTGVARKSYERFRANTRRPKPHRQSSQSKPILSAADIKKTKGKKQSQADIRRVNKLSGFDSISARFVQGGSATPK